MADDLPPIIPRERQPPKKTEGFKQQDSVSTPATTFYSAKDEICKEFPLLFGTVISSSKFSAVVQWDMDGVRVSNSKLKEGSTLIRQSK